MKLIDNNTGEWMFKLTINGSEEETAGEIIFEVNESLRLRDLRRWIAANLLDINRFKSAVHGRLQKIIYVAVESPSGRFVISGDFKDLRKLEWCELFKQLCEEYDGKRRIDSKGVLPKKRG